jgi:hypothetical protein
MSDKPRIITVAESSDEFVTLEDGFVYYWPSKEHYGALTATELRALADELDRRNAEWQATIDNDPQLAEAACAPEISYYVTLKALELPNRGKVAGGYKDGYYWLFTNPEGKETYLRLSDAAMDAVAQLYIGILREQTNLGTQDSTKS